MSMVPSAPFLATEKEYVRDWCALLHPSSFLVELTDFVKHQHIFLVFFGDALYLYSSSPSWVSSMIVLVRCRAQRFIIATMFPWLWFVRLEKIILWPALLPTKDMFSVPEHRCVLRTLPFIWTFFVTRREKKGSILKDESTDGSFRIVFESISCCRRKGWQRWYAQEEGHIRSYAGRCVNE